MQASLPCCVKELTLALQSLEVGFAPTPFLFKGKNLMRSLKKLKDQLLILMIFRGTVGPSALMLVLQLLQDGVNDPWKLK